MNGPRKKRSLSIHGHRTSISLEPEFWHIIENAAKSRQISLAGFITTLDDKRTEHDLEYGLAAYLRLWALRYVLADKPEN
ncbi:MAG TPA: aryl-sulfate sulfotransferase [Hellea balneolensis]|uniref:Aryl-sulfate sulfotransferase n=1 Tax=Hellea balneolensis TaxID=287478 RepID=A0A7C5R3X6_9PROT|nr:aryl-sulfate sulfotransferase [Hellea balneolensis]